MKDLKEQLSEWEQRMKRKAKEEEADEKQRVHNLQQSYLRRTGRKEMKP